MKSTIASDFRDWLSADNDEPAISKAKFAITWIYTFTFTLWTNLFISAALLGNWDDARHAAFTVAQIAGAGAAFLWGWKALDRWRDLAIARIQAEETDRP